ncbi:hypothetical protein VNO77_31072 [Canavalia gladiata]|uniref:Uncharacterized protein n=1 Tax=Canavalia gladiata TaxID=3824 RepID=A0AAN9KRN8_CANGL
MKLKPCYKRGEIHHLGGLFSEKRRELKIEREKGASEKSGEVSLLVFSLDRDFSNNLLCSCLTGGPGNNSISQVASPIIHVQVIHISTMNSKSRTSYECSCRG